MRGENELLSSGTGQAWNKMLKLTFFSGKKRSYTKCSLLKARICPFPKEVMLCSIPCMTASSQHS